MYETNVSVVGNLVADPVMRETESGRKVAGFRIAVTERRWDAQEKSYVDARTSFYGVSCWSYLGTNVADCLGKGDRVMVTGRLSVREYTVDDKLTRNSVEIDAVAVGHDLTFGTTKFTRVIRAAEAGNRPPAEGGGNEDAPDVEAGDADDPFGSGEYVEVDGMTIDRAGVVLTEV